MTTFYLPKGALIFQNDRDSIYSKAINLQTSLEKRFKEKGKIGHVAICLGDFLGQTLILEADNKITDINFLEKFKPHNHYLEVFDIGKFIKEDNLDYALRQIIFKYKLVEYGKTQILGFVLEPFMRLFGKNENMFKDGVICSELGVYYLQALGYKDLLRDNNTDVNLVTPTDLYEICHSLFGYPHYKKDYDSTIIRLFE